jgi:hypothetical protein
MDFHEGSMCGLPRMSTGRSVGGPGCSPRRSEKHTEKYTAANQDPHCGTVFIH